MKKFILTASLAATALFASPAHAAETLSGTSCTPFLPVFFSNITPTACSGFWNGNAISGPVPAANVLTALQGLGFTGTQYIQKLENLGGTNTLDFTQPLSGLTIVGIHWGGGVFKDFDLSELEKGGGGTAFFVFNAGTNLDKIFLSDAWKKSSSNAALFQTGVACTGQNCGPSPNCTVGGCGTVVPEPSTYALMASGLLGIFGFARRRRNNA